jgi:hypothetical protein
MADDRVPVSLYEQNLNAWALSQAATLRAVGEAASRGEDRPADLPRSLDWNDLAEEIEGLARKDQPELGSRNSVIVEHLVKPEFSQQDLPRSGSAPALLTETLLVTDGHFPAIGSQTAAR